MVEKRAELETPVSHGAFPMPRSLQKLMQAFETAGFQCVLQGRAAQEIVRGVIPESYGWSSIISTGSPAQNKEVIGQFKTQLKTYTEGRTVKIDNFPVEGAGGKAGTLRVSSLRKRTPPTQWFAKQNHEGIAKDLSTREVTLFAFGLKGDGTPLDPFGGVSDSQNNILRSVVPAKRVFKENGLWALKLARFIGDTGLTVDDEVLSYARKHAGRILDVPVPLWTPHLNRILLSDHVEEALEFLLRSECLQFVVPEVVSMVDFHTTCPVHHKDLWDHTKRVIAQAEKNVIVRWAALMHDIGKVWTRSVNRERKVHFFRHEEFGALLFQGVAGRLQLEPEFAARIDYVIRNHSRVNLYDSSWTDSAVRRLIRECGDYLDELILFSKADFTTKRESKVRELRRQLAELDERIASIKAMDAKPQPLPKGLGAVLMAEFKIPAGKGIGQLRSWLAEQVEEGTIPAQAPPTVYLDYLNQFPDRVIQAGGLVEAPLS